MSNDKSKELVFNYTVKGNPATKKNSPRILKNRYTGKQFVGQSARYKQYESDVISQLASGVGFGHEAIDFPVRVECIFYRDSARRVDLTNLLAAIDDILVEYGILADDNYKIVESHDGSRVFVDRENPRTEIKIYRI